MNAEFQALCAWLSAAGVPDARFDAAELYRFVTRRDPRLDDGPTEAEAARLAALAERRAAREPLQYILGEWDFMDFSLKVGPGVLCPRADSEVVCETAIELLKRGHRLIADNAVELRRVSYRKILGTAPANIRHFIELRGIGIINVARVFGIGSVRSSVEVEMVVQLEPWDRTKNYDRTGLETEYYDILGVKVPSMLIPVMPGRNLAVILETAAINNRQKEMGYNAAKELLTQLGLADDISK